MGSSEIIILTVGFASVIIAFVIGLRVGRANAKPSQTDLSGFVSRELHQRELDDKRELKEERETLRQQLLELNRQLSAYEQEKINLGKKLEEHTIETDRLRDEFYKQFKLTAAEIIEKNSESFRKKSNEEMTTLLSPLQEKLASFEKKVQDTYEKGMKERESLKTVVEQLSLQNKTLSEEAQNLTKALKGDVKKQGNWGEVILERLLESSGLRKGIEYFTQESYGNEDGKRQRPDVVVQLPDEKYIIIDSKVSLVAYDRLASATDSDEADKALKEHHLSVKAHIKGLAEKEYQKLHGDRSPDFVFLFIPIEGAFNAALQFDNQLYQEALDKNIIIVSTTTLLATLRTVASIWKQEYQNQNIRKIADEGAKLYDKVAGFIDEFNKLGQRIQSAQSAYETAMNRLATGKGNILRRAENMKKLGLQTTKSIDPRLLDSDNDTDENE